MMKIMMTNKYILGINMTNIKLASKKAYPLVKSPLIKNIKCIDA